MQVLAGDIGGTKTLLQLSEFDQHGLRVVAEQRFDSTSYDGLSPMVEEFLGNSARGRRPQAASFGIAGPITSTSRGAIAKVTNLPWVVDSAELSTRLATPRVRLINDFQAVAYGIEALSPDDLLVLQSGERQPEAPCAVVGAGTGLGQALLVWQDGHYEAIATEGGHVDFAPTDDIQAELLRFLHARYGRVSYERILSGAGIVSLYSFFASRGHVGDKHQVAEQAENSAAAITNAALQGNDKLAVSALQLFVKIYGAHAGNVALGYLPAGGVFIAGGIAPKILPALQDGNFVRAFCDKGRMSALLAAMPVYLIINERVGLLGAARVASRLCNARA